MPLTGVVLGAEDGGRHLVPSFHQLQYIPGFCLLQRVQQPLVQNEQLHLFQLLHIFPIGPIPLGYSDLHQKIRQPEIPSGVEVPVGRHTQGTGQECLSSTGSAQDDHISCFLNVRTGCQAEDLLPVQMPFGNILDILHAGLCICIAGLLDQASEPVAFPRTPFGIHQHGESILEGHIPELRVFQLGRKLLCHDAHVDLSELTNRFVTEHYFFPLL